MIDHDYYIFHDPRDDFEPKEEPDENLEYQERYEMEATACIMEGEE